MKAQFTYDAFRFDFLKNYFADEIIEYCSELGVSKKKEDKDMLALWGNRDQNLIDQFMILWLERCKYKHSMAFMQARNKQRALNISEKAWFMQATVVNQKKNKDLKEAFDLFEDRKQFLRRMLEMIGKMRQHEMVNCQEKHEHREVVAETQQSKVTWATASNKSARMRTVGDVNLECL